VIGLILGDGSAAAAAQLPAGNGAVRSGEFAGAQGPVDALTDRVSPPRLNGEQRSDVHHGADPVCPTVMLSAVM